MKKLIKHIIILLFVVSANHTNAQQSNYYSILLTGNTSENKPDSILLKKWQKAAKINKNLAYLMLGNYYNLENDNFSKDFFINSKHPLLLVPGKNEWANGSSLGKKTIKNIAKKLQKEYKGTVYMPNAACPVPKEVVLNENLVVILIDTYWWVHKHDRRFNKCGIETNADVLLQIEDAIRRHYPTKHVIIAGHSSLKSFGNSDGYFSFKENLLKAPYTFYRKIFGIRTDNHYPDFKGFRDAMLLILQNYPDIIYASAGEENLQYFTLDSVHHIVSGAMTKTGFVKSKFTEFGSSENGFTQINFSSNGECEIIFTGLQDELFKKTIFKKEFAKNTKQNISQIQISDSISINASNKYIIPEWKYPFIGENYREVWKTPVKVPVFNILTKKDSLFIVKRGGGKQTLSLRLEDKNGRQYVLRSLEKNIEPVLPKELKNTFAVEIVQDQISTSNPYAALVVANLAEFAGIFHTNPEIVYVPDDPNFGIYRQDMAKQLFIFEERPDGDRSDVASFGNSKKIVSTDKMLKSINKDEKHSIDANSYLRARLFDILINDWDRHEDQWRWASFKIDGNTIYKPIPRDRDQAFFLNKGLAGRISSRKWLSPRFQKFDEFTENVEGLSFNARLLDRSLLIHSEWEDWQAQIDTLKILLTPENIDKAVLHFPKEIQHIVAKQTAEILKARLENIEAMAHQLYLFLAKEVNITGTNKKDIFEINALNDTTISVTGYNLNKKAEKGDKIFERNFYASETKKLHLYGLDKKDHFDILGQAKNKIELSIIGGENNDEITYKGNKQARYISIYDKKGSNISPLIKKRNVKNYDENTLEYDREAFKYDVVFPSLFSGYNKDDGIFIGGGPLIKKHSRYSSQEYKVLANYTFLTQGINLHFSGSKIYPLKHIELNMVADFKSPNYVNNYFGMGNESDWQIGQSDEEYYRVRISEYFVNQSISKFIDRNNTHKFGLGLFYKYTDIEETPNRFISDFAQNGLEQADLNTQSYAGISLNYKINTTPKEIKKENQFGGSKMFPTRGIKTDIDFMHYLGLDDNSPDFTKIKGDWVSYTSFSARPRVVYAVKFGGEKLFGDYVFNEAAKLGQNKNLRGYRLTRFYGDASLYLNTEVRIRLKQINTYLINTTGGLFIFNDIARVWLDGENSTTWHDGYGAGLWWSPFDMALLTISYAKSTDDELINFSVNYQF